jgi:hypothetical protein
LVRPAIPLFVISATDEEMTAHAEMLAVIAKASGGKCLWPVPPPPQVVSELNLTSA